MTAKTIPVPEALCLESLINILQDEPADKRVKVGFKNPHSHRGYYHNLAFEIAENVTVGEMLSAAQSALGATYQGWKGGDYTMHEYTSVWLVPEEGCSGETIGALLMHLLLENLAA